MSTKGRLKGTSPLLLLVIGTLITGMVGAAIVLYWQSGVVEWQHEFTVEGLTGEVIQVVGGGDSDPTALIANYEGKVIATTLGSGSYEYGGMGIETIDDGIMLVYIAGNADLSGGLVIDLDVVFTGSGSESITYTAVGKYALIYFNTFALSKEYSETNKPSVTFIDGTATIPSADMSFIKYDSVLEDYGSTAYEDDGNMLIIEFTFSGGGGGTLDWGDYTADIDITVSLGVNT